MLRWGCALQGAEFGVRVNSVSPGAVDTPILEVVPREQLLPVVAAAQLMPGITQPEEVRVDLPGLRGGWYNLMQGRIKYGPRYWGLTSRPPIKSVPRGEEVLANLRGRKMFCSSAP